MNNAKAKDKNLTKTLDNERAVWSVLRSQLLTLIPSNLNGSRTRGFTDVTGVGKTSVPNPRKAKRKLFLHHLGTLFSHDWNSG